MILVAYTRRSTDRQAASPQTQERMIRLYCKQHNHELLRVYHEEVITRKSTIERRTVLPGLIQEIKNKKRDFDGIIVWKTDRLFGNQAEFFVLLGILDKHKCKLLSVMDPVKRDTATDRFLSSIMAAANTYEVELTGERIYAHHLSSFMQGKWPGGPQSLGISWDKAQGKFLPDERADDVVRIFDLYIQMNGNATATAKELNRLGVPSPKGGMWSNGPLLCLLRNKAYRQILQYDGRELPAPDLYPRIVPEHLIKQADILLDAGRLKVSWFVGHRCPSARTYSGLLYCSECGSVLTSNGREEPGPGRYEAYAGWLCAIRRKHGQCKSRQISVTHIDYLIGVAVGELFKRLKEPIVQAASSNPPKRTRARQNSRDRLNQQRTRTIDLYANGYISEADFLSRVQDIDSKLKNLDIEPPAPLCLTSQAILDAMEHIAEDWSEVPPEEKRGLLLQIGAHITINTGDDKPFWIELSCGIIKNTIRVEAERRGRWPMKKVRVVRI